METTRPQNSNPDHTWISQPERTSNFYADPKGRFTFVARSGVDAGRLLRLDTYSAAMAFVSGKFEIRGDIFEAIRYFLQQNHSGFPS